MTGIPLCEALRGGSPITRNPVMIHPVETSRPKGSGLYTLSTAPISSDKTPQVKRPTRRFRLRKLIWLSAFLALLGMGATYRFQHASAAGETSSASEAPLRQVQV